MKNKEDKNIENLVEQMLMNTALESSSPDFTQKVMMEVMASEKRKSLIYKPILSKGAWLLIFSGMITLFIYALFYSDAATIGLNFNFAYFKFDKLEKFFNGFQISSLTGYVIIVATLTILLQTFFIKKYLDRQFES